MPQAECWVKLQIDLSPFRDGTVLTHTRRGDSGSHTDLAACLHSLCTMPLTPATNRVASSQPRRIWSQRNHMTNRGAVVLVDIHAQRFCSHFGARPHIATSPRKSACPLLRNFSGSHVHVIR